MLLVSDTGDELAPQPHVVLPGVDDQQAEVGGWVEILAVGPRAAATLAGAAENEVMARDHVTVGQDVSQDVWRRMRKRACRHGVGIVTSATRSSAVASSPWRP